MSLSKFLSSAETNAEGMGSLRSILGGHAGHCDAPLVFLSQCSPLEMDGTVWNRVSRLQMAPPSPTPSEGRHIDGLRGMNALM
jgi:hypothetical protein